jgi:hypothetical protein
MGHATTAIRSEEIDMKKRPAITSTMLHDQHMCDQVSKSKGVFKFRQGYFYRSGTPEGFANRISRKLTELNIDHTVLESGDVWKEFKGSATLRNQSHYWVNVNIKGYKETAQ